MKGAGLGLTGASVFASDPEMLLTMGIGQMADPRVTASKNGVFVKCRHLSGALPESVFGSTFADQNAETRVM